MKSVSSTDSGVADVRTWTSLFTLIADLSAHGGIVAVRIIGLVVARIRSKPIVVNGVNLFAAALADVAV